MANGFGSLYIGASGLQNSQNALNTTSNNLANVNTKGYVAGFTGRQKLHNLQYNCIDQPAAVWSWHEDR